MRSKAVWWIPVILCLWAAVFAQTPPPRRAPIHSPVITAINASGPAVVNISYQGDQVAGLTPSSLRLHRWDESGGRWVSIDGVSDPDFNIVSSEVDRLADFALFGGTSAIFSDGFEGGSTEQWSATLP